jgi:hypothetical protein
MKRRYTWCVVAVAALALGASAVPVFAADSGTVNAQIVVGGTACLTVSSSVDFGTAQFQAPGSNGAIVGTPSVAVTSCSTATETILARGTDATAPGVQWTLATAAPCPIAAPTTNQYSLGLRLTGGSDTYLSTTNASLGSVAANGTLTRTPLMRMPCTGSAGQGQTMSMSYVFTAIP